MKWSYIIGPDWTDKAGLAVLIRWTSAMTAKARDDEFLQYVERALQNGHSGVTIHVAEEK